MAYTRINWSNGGAPAINETNLNKMDEAIYNNDLKLTGKETINNIIYAKDFKTKNLANINDFNVDGANSVPNEKRVYDLQPNTTYTLSFTKSRISGVSISQTSIWNLRRIVYYNGNTQISTQAGEIIGLGTGASQDIAITITTPANCNNIIINFSNYNNDANVNTKVSNVQLEIGNEKTNYEKHIIQHEEYSREEIRIGTWINGKPIYRKVIDFGALPNASTKSVLHNIQNLETFTKYEGIATNNSFWFILPHVVQDTPTNSVEISVNTTTIFIKTGSDRSAYSAYIILEYTKTTD